MKLTSVKATDTGVIIFEFYNNQEEEDTIYITADRLLYLLQSVSNHDGVVIQSSKVALMDIERLKP